MKLKYNKISVLLTLILAVLIVSCNDDAWQSHYNTVPENKIDSTIMEYIKSRSDLKIFTQMLEKTGYDTLLSEPQSFTVWAPEDASLEDVDLTNLTEVRKIVENHITRYLHTTSGISSTNVLMMDKKYIVFSKLSGVATFGGKTIVESDIATNNGIIHILGDYVPYQQNLWEYINETSGLDSLKAYLNSLTLLEFDPEASFENGVLVDSVMKETNDVLDYLADLKSEDSIYTAILPDNDAWKRSYDSIFPYYRTLESDGGVAMQRAYTRITLVKDLFFRNKIEKPVAADTLTATSGTEFANPARLFKDASLTKLSNGYGYVATKLNNTSGESWAKEIRIEAETSVYGRYAANYTENIYSSLGTAFSVSNKYYLSLTDAASSSLAKVFVTFPLPNTLSTKYNIYCVFVPSKIIDTTDVRPYKVKFSLQYVDESGEIVDFAAVDKNHQVGGSTKATFITNPDSIDKMLVAENFEFPYQNQIDFTDSNFKNNISVVLKVDNAATKTEKATYSRDLKIDCIILEPVQ
ncbi:MAG: fasciclin domain-containing protein [Paludibacter sp.]|nr:fasciclin domain-containing protein [Paludibacter sp.]